MLERLRSLLLENLALKLLSFAVALVLYSMVHGGQDTQRTVAAKLVVLPPPEARVLVSPLPPEVRATVRGPRSAIDDLSPDDLVVQVDLRSGQDKRVTFEPSMLQLPANVRVDRFDPSFIDFKWEDQILRDVPVQVGVVGAPAPGFVVKGAPTPTPAAVRAKGPKSDVLVLQHARTDALDVTGLTEGTYKRALAIKPAERIGFDAKIIDVTVEIAREVAEGSFTKLPVAVLGVPKGKTLPAEVDVRLVCPPEVLHALRAEQIVPRVSVPSGAPPQGSQALPVELDLSKDKCAATITPATVVVRW